MMPWQNMPNRDLPNRYEITTNQVSQTTTKNTTRYGTLYREPKLGTGKQNETVEYLTIQSENTMPKNENWNSAKTL
jgi:hypothetical protein